MEQSPLLSNWVLGIFTKPQKNKEYRIYIGNCTTINKITTLGIVTLDVTI